MKTAALAPMAMASVTMMTRVKTGAVTRRRSECGTWRVMRSSMVVSAAFAALVLCSFDLPMFVQRSDSTPR